MYASMVCAVAVTCCLHVPSRMQVISLMRDAFQAAGLGAYLHPYGCIPTGYERGVIEVVPHTKSRWVG